jgi:hypothetical protein
LTFKFLLIKIKKAPEKLSSADVKDKSYSSLGFSPQDLAPFLSE